ncbi:N(2)-fixation sustaining protein CowN [Rhodoferax sp.]|uniref:N(2)-fixation sustaining protein CowN n=1 Tax=Rhodoferax sp. TaxID=50421 RepID=UPI002841BA83|nr:N(2)-fixation sustaining protein CowN [Rhodoferax sp.]MDR3369525.1 N(2)-fixation sustaining protein CowN [Rhodoferax sp.]
MTTVDRYRTFKGIDFDGQANRMLARIEALTQGTDDPFWAYFFKRRNATQGMRCDDQLLLSSFVNQIRELLEARGDDQGIAWLDQLEAECF